MDRRHHHQHCWDSQDHCLRPFHCNHQQRIVESLDYPIEDSRAEDQSDSWTVQPDSSADHLDNSDNFADHSAIQDTFLRLAVCQDRPVDVAYGQAVHRMLVVRLRIHLVLKMKR